VEGAVAAAHVRRSAPRHARRARRVRPRPPRCHGALTRRPRRAARRSVSFIDGKTTTADPKEQVCGCKKTSAAFTNEWKAKVVADAGKHYRVPHQHELAGARAHAKPARDKLTIRGVAP
jgi:hypothetical protein